MRGSSDGDTGGMWWLGNESTDAPPPPERRHEPAPPPLERAYREVTASPNQPPPPLGGDSSPYAVYAPDDEAPPPNLPPSRASRPPVPPPPPTPPRRVPKRRHRAAWPARLGLLILAIVVGSVGVLVWRGGPVSGFALPLGLGQPQATPTHIGFAKQAKITFTRATQQIAASSSTLVVATDGSGQAAAKQIKTNVSQVPSAAQNALYQIASPVVFTLTVTNNSSNPAASAGVTISSTDGKATCTVQNNVTVQAHSTAQQQCITPLKSEPAASWNDSTSNPPLVYSGSSPAGGSSAYYYVPTNCGDPSPANQAARTSLQGQLNTPAGATVMFGPTVAIDSSSLTCAPAAGTQQPDAFSFVQKINASASETVFTLADVQAYQTAQLQKAVPTTSVLIASAICPDGPKVGTDATATKATITCPTTGTVGWNWTPDALNQLAQSIAGLGVGSAALQLNQTAGITPGSAKIDLVDGSLMPAAATAITFAITP